MDNSILTISGVSKKYRLGMIGGTTLKEEIQRKIALRKGLDDPTKKVTDDSTAVTGAEFLALNNVSFTVDKGERVGIIGHNGAGKSTLLKLISRITAPTDGFIEMNGRIASMLEVGTGFHPELTGRENIYMNGAILGMTKAEIDKKIEDIIEFSECRKFIDTPVKRYSSGMYVKLAFSVAAHLESEIMIMDEVLAVGDMAFQKKCLDKMNDVSRKDGRTILYVSHNMNTIRQLCDRCIVLDHGTVIFDGDTEDAISIYLNQEQTEQTPFVNLVNRERPDVINKKAFMQSFEFLGKEDCIYKRGEPIKFKLKWKSLDNLEEVKFRMILRYRNDVPVGLVQSLPLVNGVSGEDYENSFEFDTSLLADGKYFFSIALYQNDKLGNSVILDHITRACSFDIISPVDDNRMLNWEHKYWGSVAFPDLKGI